MENTSSEKIRYGTIGITLTNKQYENSYYSVKETAVITTTFSAVSITSCIVVIENVDLTNYFAPFYLTVALVSIACALIVPLIVPPSMKKTHIFLMKSEIWAKLFLRVIQNRSVH